MILKFIFVLMTKHLFPGIFFLLLLSVTVCYASNERPRAIERLVSKPSSKLSEKAVSEKLLKVRSVEKQSAAPHIIKTPNAADTFESLIAPFLKVMTPRFYDQIIKKGKSLQVQS